MRHPNGEPDLGPCCGCQKTGPTVRAVGMLGKKCPMPGRGWGCVQCGLSMDGAIVVMCDACDAAGVQPKWACKGRPGTDGLVPIESLAGEHRHDMAKHPEAVQHNVITDNGRTPSAAEAETYLRRVLNPVMAVNLLAGFRDQAARGNPLSRIHARTVEAFTRNEPVSDVDVLGLAWFLVAFSVDPALLSPAYMTEGVREPSSFDVEHLGAIVEDAPGFTNFDAHLFRLIKKGDRDERERLRVVYPHHVEALEQWERGGRP